MSKLQTIYKNPSLFHLFHCDWKKGQEQRATFIADLLSWRVGSCFSYASKPPETSNLCTVRLFYRVQARIEVLTVVKRCKATVITILLFVKSPAFSCYDVDNILQFERTSFLYHWSKHLLYNNADYFLYDNTSSSYLVVSVGFHNTSSPSVGDISGIQKSQPLERSCLYIIFSDYFRKSV